MTSFSLPKGFIWGAATAAYQIEGAVAEGGRAPSVWDTFCELPGRVFEGQSGRVACDHYHRFEEDVKLMAEMGLKGYRFSIAWSRIMPEGTGRVNQAGLDFYKRLLDALERHGITPYATLFHWDSPQALEDRFGSWQSPEMANAFAEYCQVVVRALGGRIQNWMTVNEIVCFTRSSYAVGRVPYSAPGTTLPNQQLVNQTVHHALLAHGKGAQAIRAASPGPCRVGIADNPATFVPLAETPEHTEATLRAFRRGNGGVLVPILTGEYDTGFLEDCSADAPVFSEEDLKNIAQPLDFLGINLYTASYVRASRHPRGFEELPFPRMYPTMNMPWLRFVPDSMLWAARGVASLRGNRDLDLFITENGAACQDQLTQDGEVLDTDRILYLREYLRSLQRAIDSGEPYKGYFAWSLLDNFEWSSGYDRRFGLIHVNYDTQKRTPKASAKWFAEVIRHNAVI